MNYLVTLAFEHCVVSTTLYDSPANLEEDELVAIAVDSIGYDFPTVPNHFHDVEITSWEDS